YPTASADNTVDSYADLILKLFKTYESEFLPFAETNSSANEPFPVYLLVQGVTIQEIDEIGWMVNTISSITLSWIDYRLRWNSNEFGNITRIFPKAQKVWRPEVYMCLSADNSIIEPDTISATVSIFTQIKLFISE
ncbi:hypothetical protein PMAYCL1PPCAC_14670, partial [Pristionchus mayeri]